MTGNRGLFLDFDGTLADSLSVMENVYYRFLESVDRNGSIAEFRTLVGPPLDAVVSSLKRTHDLGGSLDLLRGQYLSLVDAAYGDVQPAVGATTLLDTATQRGWRVSIVTSNSRLLVESWLRRCGFEQQVSFVIASEDVSRGKPDPEPYLMAIHKSGCRVLDSIAVEDSPQGAHASVGAGLETVSVCRRPDDYSDWPERVSFVSRLDQLVDRL